MRRLIRAILHFLRLQKPFTTVFGRVYRVDPYQIEIDITYDCNLKCFNCNRSCRQAPSKGQVSLAQIDKFISESIKQSRRWKRIRILGGEPTLHPDFIEIISRLLSYKREFSPDTVIQVATNGFGVSVNEVLGRLNKEVLIENTFKSSIVNQFSSFNAAPRDSFMYKFADYSNGCYVINGCGMGLTPFGYYPCAVSGGIDRVLGFDLGRTSLPEVKDHMLDLLERFCQYCGNFKIYVLRDMAKDEKMSISWIKAYKDYTVKKPVLREY
jgi:hypothetical protein